MQHMLTHKAVTRRIEAKKLLTAKVIEKYHVYVLHSSNMLLLQYARIKIQVWNNAQKALESNILKVLPRGKSK